MATIEEKYQFTTEVENVTEKDWAAGSRKQIEVKEYVIKKIGNTLVGGYETVKYSPAWWKLIDEPIVNAIDHLIRCLGTGDPVTIIKVGFDKTGRIRIYNNGPGVEVAIHKVASEHYGRETYVPTFIFGNLFQGGNRTRAEDSIIGGTNGIGAKLCNFFSNDFIFETVDGKRNLFFQQQWRNHRSVEEKPIVVDLAKVHKIPREKTIPHTTLSFLPDYTGLFEYERFDERVYNTLVDVVRTRVVFAAAYAHYAISTSGSKQPFSIYFNEDLVNVKSMADIANIMFPGMPMVKTMVSPAINAKAKSRAAYTHTWEVCAVILKTSSIDTPQISNVNGIMVRDGKHVKHLMNLLIKGVEEKISKVFKDKNLKFSSTYVTGNVFILVNSKIPNPDWSGQRKDVLDTDIRKFGGYIPDTKFIGGVSDQLRDKIIESIFGETENAKSKKKSKQCDYAKYVPAKKCNGKRARECTLIPVEGDSAMTQVSIGISHNLSFDTYGIISLGGVIMNARKECTVLETDNGKFIKKSTKLAKNLLMNVLMEVTGLNPVYKYDPKSTTYRKEMSELKYGCIAACVDQDLDGKGNILGLLISTFELFWPNLLRAGFIKWFCTPLTRAYPKKGGRCLEFYSELEYDNWLKTADTSQYRINYYKGLGTHTEAETKNMFKHFHKHLYTYYLDDQSHELFEIYFGDKPDLRKKELSQPTKVASRDLLESIEKSMTISCSHHLEHVTNLYQKDNLERKLDHVIDGQNQSGRKILDGSIKAFKNRSDNMKVAQLAGYISEHENYHHGEASLADSITGKALVTPGGKQLPILVPIGNFGSRKQGGADASPPRYIHTTLNKRLTNLLFPDIDYWILPFNFDEGKRSEPKYFVPIIPMAVIESTELPAHGWKLKTWGRDVFKVIENVRRMIRNGDDTPLLKMPPTTYKGSEYEWKGELKTIRGEPFSFGKYRLEETQNLIVITELPLRVWTTRYVKKLKKMMMHPNNNVIASIHDSSNNTRVNIEVKLKPDALALIADCGDSYFTDSIEEYFMLRDRMDSHINLMGVQNEVIMFQTYEEVMYHWFPVRKEYYGKRIDRQRALLRLNIRYLENMIRFVENCIGMNLPKRKYVEMQQILSDAKYDKIYVARIKNPKFTPTEELEQVVLASPKANYDYLLDLSDRKKSEESLTGYHRDLKDKIKELDELNAMASQGRFPGAMIWEAELDELSSVIRQGMSTKWFFEEIGKYTFE
jgi:DNA gyrase/topoisomerase IV subunit B